MSRAACRRRRRPPAAPRASAAVPSRARPGRRSQSDSRRSRRARSTRRGHGRGSPPGRRRSYLHPRRRAILPAGWRTRVPVRCERSRGPIVTAPSSVVRDSADAPSSARIGLAVDARALDTNRPPLPAARGRLVARRARRGPRSIDPACRISCRTPSVYRARIRSGRRSCWSGPSASGRMERSPSCSPSRGPPTGARNVRSSCAWQRAARTIPGARARPLRTRPRPRLRRHRHDAAAPGGKAPTPTMSGERSWIRAVRPRQ